MSKDKKKPALNLLRDPVADTAELEWPWNPAITVVVRRFGHPTFRRKLLKRESRGALGAFELYLKREGLTVKDARKVEASEWQRRIEDMPMSELLPLMGQNSPEEVAELIERMDGLTDAGEAIEYTPEIGAEILTMLPQALNWVQAQAQELEADFQAAVELCRGNSSASSDGTPAEEAATSSSGVLKSSEPTVPAESSAGATEA